MNYILGKVIEYWHTIALLGILGIVLRVAHADIPITLSLSILVPILSFIFIAGGELMSYLDRKFTHLNKPVREDKT